MTTTTMPRQFIQTNSKPKPRLAGALYVASVSTAVVGESLLHGGAAVLAGLVAVIGMIAVALLVFEIFKHVNNSLALLATGFSIAGGALEAIRLNPWGVDLAVVLHGCYCIGFGYLMFRANSLPRIFGVTMALAGLSWLLFLSPALVERTSTYALGVGFAGEALPMLWLLVIGTKLQAASK